MIDDNYSVHSHALSHLFWLLDTYNSFSKWTPSRMSSVKNVTEDLESLWLHFGNLPALVFLCPKMHIVRLSDG